MQGLVEQSGAACASGKSRSQGWMSLARQLTVNLIETSRRDSPSDRTSPRRCSARALATTLHTGRCPPGNAKPQQQRTHRLPFLRPAIRLRHLKYPEAGIAQCSTIRALLLQLGRYMSDYQLTGNVIANCNILRGRKQQINYSPALCTVYCRGESVIIRSRHHIYNLRLPEI